ncbi:MAG TPA: slipin family protein [Acidilobales archaeon]|nr:slipin family protein [Acidilobales archaeon]
MEFTLIDIVLMVFGLIVVIAILSASIKIVREYERAVIFRLGRLLGAKGPGIFFIIPFVDSMVRVDLRVVGVDVPKQNRMTRDNVSTNVDAVVYYRVVDPERAVTKVENYHYAISLLAQTTLRDILGQVELDELLTKREEINKKLQEILDEMTGGWGIKVVAVTLKDVELPESLRRAMAMQAEAERWRRARIISAEGEREAAKIMAEAAKMYEAHPAALRLRELQTLVDVAKEKNLIVVTEGATLSTPIATAAALIKKTSQSRKGR